MHVAHGCELYCLSQVWTIWFVFKKIPKDREVTFIHLKSLFFKTIDMRIRPGVLVHSWNGAWDQHSTRNVSQRHPDCPLLTNYIFHFGWPSANRNITTTEHINCFEKQWFYVDEGSFLKKLWHFPHFSWVMSSGIFSRAIQIAQTWLKQCSLHPRASIKADKHRAMSVKTVSTNFNWQLPPRMCKFSHFGTQIIEALIRERLDFVSVLHKWRLFINCRSSELNWTIFIQK